MRPETLKKIAAVYSVIKEAGEIHLRGIARALEMNPFTVEHIIKTYLSPFLDVRRVEAFGIRIKIFKIRKEASLEEILKNYETRKRIREK